MTTWSREYGINEGTNAFKELDEHYSTSSPQRRPAIMYHWSSIKENDKPLSILPKIMSTQGKL